MINQDKYNVNYAHMGLFSLKQPKYQLILAYNAHKEHIIINQDKEFAKTAKEDNIINYKDKKTANYVLLEDIIIW